MSESTRPTVMATLDGAPSASWEAVATVLDAHLARAAEPSDGEVLARGYSRSGRDRVALIVSAESIASAREMLRTFTALPHRTR